MFNTNTRSTSQQRGNTAAKRAEVQRLSKEYGLEAFLNPQSSSSSEPMNPFESFPAEKPVEAKAPVVVVVKRRRLLAVAA